MINCAINIDIIAGTDIKDACADAIELAKKLNCMITFDFNNVNMFIIPSDNVEKCITYFYKQLNSRGGIK